MKQSTWFRTACLLLAAIGALAAPRSALANPIVPVTLEFEREGLDLETGTIVPMGLRMRAVNPAGVQPDLLLTCNSERTVRAVVLHNRMNGVEIAFLDGVAFNLVDSAQLTGLSFTAEVVDEPFETGDSVVLRTDTGAHYLLGNPIEGVAGVTFDTQLLDVTTAGLVRPAVEGTILARRSIPRGVAPQSTSPALSPGLSAEDRQQIRDLIEQDRYRFGPVSERPGAFAARNAAHGLQAELDGAGLRLSSLEDAWDWSLALTAYGFAGALRPAEAGELVAQANRLEHRRGDLVEWYVNDGRGLEQGFTLAAPPAGERVGSLALTLVASGSLSPVPAGDGTGVQLVDGGGRTVLRYAGLLAWDATGRELPARLATQAGNLSIEVDDAGAVYPVTIDPTVVHEDAKLSATDPATEDWFGISVALSGDTAVVGASLDDHAGGPFAGSAYVFVRNGTSWSQQAKLNASDAADSAEFGSSVAISGDTALVGAIFDSHAGGTFAGSVYVFVRSGTSWYQQAKLTASDAAAFDLFGNSVALSGNTAVVGALFDDHAGDTDAGSAYVFVRSGTSWFQQRKLTAGSDAHAHDVFGQSVAISGDTVVVGVYYHTHAAGTDSGSAYVFVRSGINWPLQRELIASDAATEDRLGVSVAISGDTVVAGAFRDDHAGHTDAGSAYVFVRSGTSWFEQARLTASDAADFDEFGWSVGVSGDTVVVGAYRSDHAGGTSAGSAYVFVRSGTAWFEQAKLTASDAAAFDEFGWTVATSGDTVVVGAVSDDHANGIDAGSAYVFQFNQPPAALCADVTVSAGSECAADVSIDAGSFDPDGDPVTLGQDPPSPYGLGDTLVTLTATDDQGASASCLATVSVEDTTPPELAVTLTPETLWPPNHRLVDVDFSVVATDACGTPSVVLTLVSSNEADNGVGDGNTINDIQDAAVGTPDFSFKLRAERAGVGNGRIYTAVYTATDAAGNAGSAAGFAVVPHDQGGITDPLEAFLEQNTGGTLVRWNEAPGAQSYDVIRGQLSNIAETDAVISLGPVSCIEPNSTDENTAGWEDSDLPDPGQAFFYLVEYDDGTSSTYGTESAEKPRAPGPGDCQ